METIQFNSVDLAELLPRIPDSIKNGLPFGLVKLDLQGNILEYNMAEGSLTGVDPNWALGRNFFDEVAMCTKTQAFYGRFVEGVKKGFMNTVFDYVFDHRDEGVRVKVHMVMVPDHLGRKNVMLLVKRVDKPVVMQATPDWPPKDEAADFQRTKAQDLPPAAQAQLASAAATTAATAVAPAPAQPNLKDVVEAVMAIMNQSTGGDTQQLALAALAKLAPAAAVPAAAAPVRPVAAPVPVPAPVPAPAPAAVAGVKHEDIFKF
jgi:photoactive yellow protein